MSSAPHAVGSLLFDERVSSSGPGDVLLARQPGLGRRVRVRILRRESLEDAGRVARFRREARMAARACHANVQQVFDLFAWQGDHYLVLEHVEGESLGAWLGRLGRPPREVATCLALELARGLEALHAAGIVHADLLAENVRVGRWGEVKLEGLGWARTAGEQVPAPPPSACTAPEVAVGAAPDARSDVYALACIAEDLFAARSLPSALRRARKADPRHRPSAARLRARLERELADASVPGVRARIAAWLVQQPAEAPAPVAERGRASQRFVAAARRVALAGAAAGLVAAAFAGWQRRDLLRPPVSSPSTVVRAARAEPASVDAAPPVSAAAPEPARLRFAVFPWGEIRIDGGDPILTPRAAPVELAPGLHRIEIAHPTLGTEVREIALRAGEQRTLHHVFDRTAAR